MPVGRTLSIALAFFVLAGCAASQTPLNVDTSDPMWTPPGQGDLAVADSPEAPSTPKRPPRARALQEPNHAPISAAALREKRAQR